MWSQEGEGEGALCQHSGVPEQYCHTYHILPPPPSSPQPSCRSQFRRQKRWWSAYLLFYERKDFSDMPDAPVTSEGGAVTGCDRNVMYLYNC